LHKKENLGFETTICIFQGRRQGTAGAEIQFGRIRCEEKSVEFERLATVGPELAALASGAGGGEDGDAGTTEFAANVFSESGAAAARAAQPPLDRDGAGHAAP
jgi:hypothetical protein